MFSPLLTFSLLISEDFWLFLIFQQSPQYFQHICWRVQKHCLGISNGGFSERGGGSNNRFVRKPDVAIASEVSILSKNSLAITDFHAKKTQHVQLFENYFVNLFLTNLVRILVLFLNFPSDRSIFSNLGHKNTAIAEKREENPEILTN